MDELRLLRDVEADTPPMSARARYQARAQLRYEIAYERRRRGRPPLAPILAGAATAAVMGAAIIALDDDDRHGPPPEPKIQLTSAASALQLAAQAEADESTGPIPRDDQYLYRKEITEERPLDGTGRTRTYVDENWVSVDGSRPTRNSELGRVWTTTGQVLPMLIEELDVLPTDPGQLLLHVRDWPDDGRDSGEPMSAVDYDTAYMYLSMLLFHQPPMPPGLRSAIFEAMARIPGVTIVDDRVDALGRRGVAIGRPGHQATILDAATHEYLGFTNTDVRDDGERVERVSSRVATGVVDEIGERP
jgi:hypothetical protein